MYALRKVVQHSIPTVRWGSKKIAAPPIISYPVKIVQMANKIRVATEETGAPVATIGMFFEAGPKNESQDKNGLSYLIEHMAYKSFTHTPKKCFEERVACLGLKLKVQTARDHMGFYTTCLIHDAPFIIEILSDVLFNCDLNYQDMNAERCNNICQELLDEDDNCKSMVFEFLHQTAYQGTLLGQTIAGSTEMKYKKNDILTYMCEQFQPWRMVMATAGGLAHRDFVELVDRQFGGYQPNPCVIRCVYPTRYTGSEMLFRNDNLSFAHVAIAVEAPGLLSADYVPFLVASSIMGSWDRSQGYGRNFASQMAQAMECIKTWHTIEPFYFAYKDTGLWGAYYVAGTMDLEDVLYNIQGQWMKLCKSVTTTDVERGINATKTALAKKYSGIESSCIDLAVQTLFTCSRRTMEDYCNQLSLITPSTIKDLAFRWIYDKCPVVAGVGPTEGLPEYNRTRAGMYWLRV